MSDTCETYRGITFGVDHAATGWHVTITTGTVEHPWETHRGPFFSAVEAQQAARTLIDGWLLLEQQRT